MSMTTSNVSLLTRAEIWSSELKETRKQDRDWETFEVVIDII